MSLQSFFVLLVLFFLVAPKQFVGLGSQLIEQLMPIVHQGLTLAIMVAVVVFIAKAL